MKQPFILLVSVAFVLSAGCGKKTIGGNGNVIEEKRVLTAFNAITVKGAFDVLLVKDNAPYVKIIADENLLPIIKTSLSDSILEIYNEKTIIRSKELKILISCPGLNSIDFSGATELSCDTVLSLTILDINISGAGRIDLSLNAKTLKTNVSGGAELVFKGQVKTLDVSITGTGNLNASGLLTDKCNIDISGFGWAKLNVKEKLEVNISGFGKIEYAGNPELKQSITGGAKVKHIENGKF